MRLIVAGLTMLKQEGFVATFARTLLWLRGERRYERRSLNDDVYREFRTMFEPSRQDLVQQRLEANTWTVRHRLGIITAIDDGSAALFRETIASVQAQSYMHWRWYIADASSDDSIWQMITEAATLDSRISPVRLPQNLGSSEKTNVALHMADTVYVVMLEQGHALAPFALYCVAQLLRENPETDFVYSDADTMDDKGQRCEPFFKPVYSPEMMLSLNLLDHLSVFRRDWLDKIGYLNPAFDGAQYWDLYLRIIERTNKIQHISKVLYHLREISDSKAPARNNMTDILDIERSLLTAHLERTGLRNIRIDFPPVDNNHSVCPNISWDLTARKRISIIIPSRDNASLLSRCLNSLFSLTIYENYQVVVVDTGSVNPETFALYDRYSLDPRWKLVFYEGEFNFSRACNLGSYAADGELLLFLNNDTEILHGDWLQLMAQWFELSEIGIVGPKLLHPDCRVQHAGVIVGFGGLADHLFAGEQEQTWSIFGSDCWYRNFQAVTGACLLIARTLFDQLHGFDENFKLNFSDVDLCLRAQAAGFRTVYTPHVRLIHQESATHQGHIPRGDFELASANWQAELQAGDPYFNSNLSYRHCVPELRRDRDDTSAVLNGEMLKRLPNKAIIDLPDDFT